MKTHYTLYHNILNDSGVEITRFRLDLVTFNNGKFKFVLPNYRTKTAWVQVHKAPILPLELMFKWNGAAV